MVEVCDGRGGALPLEVDIVEKKKKRVQRGEVR